MTKTKNLTVSQVKLSLICDEGEYLETEQGSLQFFDPQGKKLDVGLIVLTFDDAWEEGEPQPDTNPLPAIWADEEDEGNEENPGMT